MHSFAEWYREQEQQLTEALPRMARGGGLPWWSNIPGMKGLTRTLGGVDWEAAERQAGERAGRAAVAGTEADPAVQKRKQAAAEGVFEQALKRVTNSRDVLKAAREPIKAIAHAFTMGGPLVPTYAMEIMKAAHASDVDDQTLKAYFDDPAEVFQLFQQAFSTDQSLWYDPEQNQKYAPRFAPMNQNFGSEITAARDQWQRSPFRKQGLDAEEGGEITETPTDFVVKYLTREKLEGDWTIDEIEKLWQFYANEMRAAGMSVPDTIPDEDRQKLVPYAKR